jgi:hypothetical protein
MTVKLLERLWTTKETAERKGIPEPSLISMRFRKTGPPYLRLGNKKIMYRPEDVEAWLQSRRVIPGQDKPHRSANGQRRGSR